MGIYLREPTLPTVGAVKAEAARRLSVTDWYITRAMDPSDGREVPAEVLAQRSAIRAASDEIEALEPIPADFADDVRWPA